MLLYDLDITDQTNVLKPFLKGLKYLYELNPKELKYIFMFSLTLETVSKE